MATFFSFFVVFRWLRANPEEAGFHTDSLESFNAAINRMVPACSWKVPASAAGEIPSGQSSESFRFIFTAKGSDKTDQPTDGDDNCVVRENERSIIFFYYCSHIRYDFRRMAGARWGALGLLNS